jgi:hypothetical protein
MNTQALDSCCRGNVAAPHVYSHRASFFSKECAEAPENTILRLGISCHHLLSKRTQPQL